MSGNGYTGQMLWVDLTAGTTEVKPLDESLSRSFLGGRGLGIKLLSELAPQGVDPLTPENPLILTTGPYTGAGVFSAFFSVTTKAPLTGLAGSSHCGGRWGPMLKKAGFDGIVVTGGSAEPVYLAIEDGQAELKSAAGLWGKGVFETEELLQEAEGKVQICSIGPAGENLVKYAAMMNGHRAAGRSGVGAVMGAKKLKAIAVKGSGKTALHDPERVKEISRLGGKNAVEGGAAFAKYGSSMAFEVFNAKHTLPTRNFREGHFTESEKINGDTLKENYFVRDSGCAQCPLQCGNVHTIKDGPYKLDEIEGPEYETMMSFGSNCGNTNLESILMANRLCNDLGLDTISCGDIFALLMDLSDLGIISAEDLDGFAMNWGEHQSIIALIPRIAAREGIGDLLAEGSLTAAGKWGDAALARVIHSKGQEYPGYESRRSFGTGFSLVTSNRGACHLRAAFYVNEIFMGEMDADGFEANMATLLDKEHFMCIADAFLTCKFGMRNALYTWEVLTDLVNGLTGFGLSLEDLKRIGERIWTLERAFNMREGMPEDSPPVRFFEEDLADGLEGGEKLSRERFARALAHYFQMRGWDEKGNPSADKMAEMGLNP